MKHSLSFECPATVDGEYLFASVLQIEQTLYVSELCSDQ